MIIIQWNIEMDYTLYICNKNYSTWFMRSWAVMKYFDISFNEKLIIFDGIADDSLSKKTISLISKYGTIPILVDGDFVITDTLAICKYLVEKHCDLDLWSTYTKYRVIVRSLVAKMHP